MKLLWLVQLCSSATCSKVLNDTSLPAVRPIVFGLNMKTLRHYLLSTAAVYGIREAPEKLEGLEFNASEAVEVIAFNYSYHRIVS